MKKNVILVSGKARHGKDTFSSFLNQQLKGSIVLHYADYIKFFATQYYGWNGIKDEAGRALINQVGAELRNFSPDIILEKAKETIEILSAKYKFFIISDARFPKEIEFFTKDENFNAIHFRVHRPNFESELSESLKNNEYETSLDNYEDRILIENDSEEGLKEIAKEVAIFLSAKI